MKTPKKFITHYHLPPKIISWIIILIGVVSIFLTKYIPKELKSIVNGLVFILLIALFAVSLIYIFFNIIKTSSIEYEIDKIESKERDSTYYTLNSEEINKRDFLQSLLTYSKTQNSCIYYKKSFEEIASNQNILNYIRALLALFLWQLLSFKFAPITNIIFLTISIIGILYCIYIIYLVITTKKGISPITIGHIIVIYFLFQWGKSEYVSVYGNETLGSYLEKPNYTARYYVRISKTENNPDAQIMPAYLQIYSASEMEEGGENFFGQDRTIWVSNKVIKIENVQTPEGDILEFDGCPLEKNDEVLCVDQFGKEWYIRFTEYKVIPK